MGRTIFESLTDRIKIHSIKQNPQGTFVSTMQLMTSEDSAGRPQPAEWERQVSYLADEALGKAEAQRRHACALHAPRGNPRVWLEELLL